MTRATWAGTLCALALLCDQGSAALGACPGVPAGQDGWLQKGLARSYTDNGDGTITDNQTGLMWEKKSYDGSIHDWSNTYTWGMTSSPYTMNGTMVTTFLATLNTGAGFAGHTDWRIPNMNELQSVANYHNYNPAVDPVFNTHCASGCTVLTCSCTQSGYYWSSTTDQDNQDNAWYMLFPNGYASYNYKSTTNYVRAVRGGGRPLKTVQTQCDQGSGALGACPGVPAGQDGWLQKGLARSYTDNGDGTITDNKTGLMWEKKDH